MKNLKYEHQSIFPLWGRVKLNFRDRKGKEFFVRTPAAVKFFHQIDKKIHACVSGTKNKTNGTPNTTPPTSTMQPCNHHPT